MSASEALLSLAIGKISVNTDELSLMSKKFRDISLTLENIESSLSQTKESSLSKWQGKASNSFAENCNILLESIKTSKEKFESLHKDIDVSIEQYCKVHNIANDVVNNLTNENIF